MKNIFIIGVGLIGGSFALNLKKIYPNSKIIGFGRNKQNLIDAKKLRVIDDYSLDIADIENTDFVVIATPVGSLKQIATSIKPHLDNQLIIDVGSTKTSVINDIINILGDYKRFIPTHPIAGKESSGAKSADINLFNNKKLIICPMKNNSKDDVSLVKDIWQKSGAIVEEMDAITHDEIFALTSHLPHLVAFSFINLIAKNKEMLGYTGGGLKDFTRIAGSDPIMWADIFLNNRANMLSYLDKFINELESAKKLLSDYDNLTKYIKQANNNRNNLDK